MVGPNKWSWCNAGVFRRAHLDEIREQSWLTGCPRIEPRESSLAPPHLNRALFISVVPLGIFNFSLRTLRHLPGHQRARRVVFGAFADPERTVRSLRHV